MHCGASCSCGRLSDLLIAGGVVTAMLFVGLEVVHPMTRLTIGLLDAIGPYLGITRGFRMTEDWTDLFCVLLVPLSLRYGAHRLAGRAPAEGG
jgi:hypothetical protein